jgi:hypothetical protein
VPLALYDLDDDPSERRNVIDVPGYRLDVEQLAGYLRAHMERTGDPQLAAFRAALAGWQRTHALD